MTFDLEDELRLLTQFQKLIQTSFELNQLINTWIFFKIQELLNFKGCLIGLRQPLITLIMAFDIEDDFGLSRFFSEIDSGGQNYIEKVV